MSMTLKEIHNIDHEEEIIRLKDGSLEVKFVAFSGKEGDFYVFVAPSLLVSSYGDTLEDAKEAFLENIDTFCIDFMELNAFQRDAYAKSLGFKKQKYNSKNYSKAYVDQNGILNGIDLDKLTASTIETASAC